MEFTCAQTETIVCDDDNDELNNKIKRVFRDLAFRPKFNNSLYTNRSWVDKEIAKNAGDCIICSIISLIKYNNKNGGVGKFKFKTIEVEDVDDSSALLVKTSCLEKGADTTLVPDVVDDKIKVERDRGDERLIKDGMSDGSCNQNTSEHLDMQKDKDEVPSIKGSNRVHDLTLSDVLTSHCMTSSGASDTFRTTLKNILHYWFGNTTDPKLKSILRRVRFISKTGEFHQLYEWVLYGNGTLTVVVIPICRLDDLKLIPHQSYGFTYRNGSTFSSYIHKNFDANTSNLLSIPSMTWINNTCLSVKKFVGHEETDLPTHTEFTCTQTETIGCASDNRIIYVMRNVFRELAFRPKRYNNLYIDQSSMVVINKNTGDCIACSIIKVIKDKHDKHDQYTGIGKLGRLFVKPCCEDTISEHTNESVNEVPSKKEVWDGPCVLTMSDVCKSRCMTSLDTFRNTLKTILHYWFGNSPNLPLKSILRRVRFKVINGECRQLYEWVFHENTSMTVVIIPICRADDLQLLLHQSYGFTFTNGSTFSAYIHKNFDANTSNLLYIPSMTWINNTCVNVKNGFQSQEENSDMHKETITGKTKKQEPRRKRKHDKTEPQKHDPVMTVGGAYGW